MRNWGAFDSWIGNRGLPLWIGGIPPLTNSTGQFNNPLGAYSLPDAYVEFGEGPEPPTPPFVYADCLTGEAEYQVWVKDHSGTRVALVTNWSRLEYEIKLSDVGYYEIPLIADNPNIDLFEPDAQVEIWRRAPGGSWYKDWEGFHRRRRWWQDESARDMFSSIGRTYEEMLARRIMVPPQGLYDYIGDEEEYDEYGPGYLTDVMRDMAYYHCGLGADIDRQMPGFAIQADTNDGPIVAPRFRYNNLLTAMQDMSAMGADFGIIGTGAATFEFRAWYPRRGLDRTVTNTDGNAPVIFSIDRANMGYPEVIEDWLNVRNYVYVAGQGSGATRTVVERQDAVDIAESPWNRREAFYDQRQLNTVGKLQQAGDGYLAEHQKQTTFDFQYLKSCNSMYGVHWELGDLVTARYRDFQFSVRVVAVHVSFTRASGEVITPRLQLIWTD